MSGRPTKLTPQRMQRVLDSIEAGNSISVAAKSAGLGSRTLDRYLERGRAVDAEVQSMLDAFDPHSQLDDFDKLDPADRRATLFALLPHVPENEHVYWELVEGFNGARAAAEERAIAIIRETGAGYHATEKRTTTKQVLDKAGKVVTLTQTVEVERYERDWRAEAWWLERVFPDKYGRTDRLALTGADGGPVSVEDVTTKRQRAAALVEDEVKRKRDQKEESERRQAEREADAQ